MMSTARSRRSETYESLYAQYPHQTASGRREQLRMNNRATPSTNQHAMTESAKKGSIDAAIQVSAEPTLDDSQLGSGGLHRSRVPEDSQSARHVPLPASRPQSPSHSDCADPRPRSSTSKDVSSPVPSKPQSELGSLSLDQAKSRIPDSSKPSNRDSLRIPARARYAVRLRETGVKRRC